MRKYLILIITILALSGCSATMNINIEKDKITENIEIRANNQSEYNKIKNWNGFPLTLYFDQELSNPFSDSKEKESGVPYYNTSFSDTEMKANIKGEFRFDEHVKSSAIRNCFTLYNIVSEGNIYTFSTTPGLTCSFTNFDIVVTTPYKIIDNNATIFNKATNTLIWRINDSNHDKISMYLEIEISDENNEDQANQEDNDSILDNIKNTNSSILVIIVGIVFVSVIVVFFILKNKKKKISEI